MSFAPHLRRSTRRLFITAAPVFRFPAFSPARPQTRLFTLFARSPPPPESPLGLALVSFRALLSTLHRHPSTFLCPFVRADFSPPSFVLPFVPSLPSLSFNRLYLSPTRSPLLLSLRALTSADSPHLFFPTMHFPRGPTLRFYRKPRSSRCLPLDSFRI